MTEAELNRIEAHLRRSEARLARENPESPRVKRHLRELGYWKSLVAEVRRLELLVVGPVRNTNAIDEHVRIMKTIHGSHK